MEKIIRTNSIGSVLYNISKNVFTIEFGMVTFTLSMDEYLAFERELKAISNDFSNEHSTGKIQVSITDKQLILNLSPEEIISLKDLFGFKTSNLVSFKLKINYSMN